VVVQDEEGAVDELVPERERKKERKRERERKKEREREREREEMTTGAHEIVSVRPLHHFSRT
jgi:hypothetical protein